MSRAWKLRVGSPLGGAFANMPLSGALHRLANRIVHERPQPPRPTKRGTIGAEHSAKRRFTADEVRAMRARYVAGERVCDMAREFGLTRHGMASILDGITYAWVRP